MYIGCEAPGEKYSDEISNYRCMADDADSGLSLYTADCLLFAINPDTILLVLWEKCGRNSHFISCKLLNYPKLEMLLIGP